MTESGAPGTVTICTAGRYGLYADDLGVTVRNFMSRERRIAWAEISHFADGSQPRSADNPEAGHKWVLHIVLRNGKAVPVTCTEGEPAAETLTAVRQVARRYGIPADVTGIPSQDGQPPYPGLYEDPGGEPRLRYWDGTLWSPLLRPDLVQTSMLAIRKSPGSWAALPTAYGSWESAMTQARRSTVKLAISALVLAALVTSGLVMLWLPATRHAHTTGLAWIFFCLALPGVGFPFHQWGRRRFFLKLDKAAKG